MLEIIGLSLIIISVFEIGIGGQWEREQEDPRKGTSDEPIDRTEEHKDLAIASGLAIFAGLLQAFSAL